MRAPFLLVLIIIWSVGEGVATFAIGKQASGKDNQRPSPSRQLLLNDGWRYLEDPISNVGEVSKSRVKWINVNLPHTWNAFDVMDLTPGYRRSASWYERTLTLPPAYKIKRILLAFEGVNTRSEVYVNGKPAGEHVGGYLGFEFDITRYLQWDKPNVIDVRADNSIDRDVIPSQKSDFFIYGGLCRNVWLKGVSQQYVKSIRVLTPEVSAESARTTLDIEILNPRHENLAGTIEAEIVDGKGVTVASASVEKPLKEESTIVGIEMPLVMVPSLWSPDNPALYTASVRLKSSGKTIDTLAERFGFRFFEFKDHGPFLLNGKRLLLRGTQRHEEYAGLGNALPDSLQRKDILMAKEMGANFIRLAHYPQAPEVYRACDELGLLVWDELPWCRGGMGGEVWKRNTTHMLEEMIRQNFNHPSIILWSLGNELYWLPDFPGGDNTDSLRMFLNALNAKAHALDPGRLTSVRKFYEGADIPDVFSPSIWMGWYSGAYFGYEKAITEAREKYPRFLHVEYGGDSHMGRHTEFPISGDGYTNSNGWDTVTTRNKVKNISLSGDWSENYLVNLIDWHLHVSEQLDWFTGNAQWILKDFGTPLRPENPIPYVNEKGVLDRAGTPKDIYYVYKSYWTSTPEFCYIESHTWRERGGPKNTPRSVKVFSNSPEVELFLNGVSQGRRGRDVKAFPACGLSWPVNFVEGSNSLRAVAYHNNSVAAEDSMTVTYTFTKNGEADHLQLSAVPTETGSLLLTAVAVDKDGRRCLDYNKRVYFSSDGEGRLVTNYGTPAGSSVIEMANGVARIEFVPASSGDGVIEVSNQDFKGEFLRIHNAVPQ